MQLWNAAAVFVWLGIPVANILLGIFPAHINRWLGVAALVYYGILTPFLFQVGSWCFEQAYSSEVCSRSEHGVGWCFVWTGCCLRSCCLLATPCSQCCYRI